MKSLAFRKDQGISIRKLNIVMVIVAGVVSLALTFAMYRTNVLHKQTVQLTEDIVEMEHSANSLMDASDYLTEEIRKFVVTGERKHLNNYFEEAVTTKRREKALETLKAMNPKSVAYHNLEVAMDNSKELMNTEYYAAKLAIEAYNYNISTYPEVIKTTKIKEQDEALSSEKKMEMAEKMLFDEVYTDKKMHISSHIQKCLEDLEEEMQDSQRELENRFKKQVFVEHLLTFVLIFITLGIVFLTSRLTIFPLNKAVDRIREEQDIPLEGAYEVRFLAKTYNLMYQTNMVNKEKLNYEATHDKLTGLYNRRGYDFLLKNVDLETSALLVIDLDNFKHINDTFGHDVGDKVLIKAADIIYNSFRQQDYICRIGGDEFAVIMVHADPMLKELIGRKVQLMNQKMQDNSDGVPICSFSVGVAFGEEHSGVEEVFKNADTALYNAKQEGRCGVKFAET